MSRYGYGYGNGYGYGGWAPYVPVAARRRQALKKMDALRKKGVDIQPVEIEGRKIAKSFWGSPGATTWSRSATMRTVCPAVGPTSAMARSAIWRSTRGACRRKSPARNFTTSR